MKPVDLASWVDAVASNSLCHQDEAVDVAELNNLCHEGELIDAAATNRRCYCYWKACAAYTADVSVVAPPRFVRSRPLRDLGRVVVIKCVTTDWSRVS